MILEIAASLLLASSPADPTIRTFGVAVSKCEVWTQHKPNPQARFLQLDFANGFLTALSVDGGPGAIPDSMNVEAALARIDWYCTTFPEWTVGQAFAALLGEIRESTSGR